MQVAVVGPTHPIKGGVAQHTTVLAQRLAAAGHETQIVSWSRQYPKRLYPGRQTVEEPEFEPFEPAHRPLSWNRPDSWLRTARRLRHMDLVVYAHITPVQIPPYWTMMKALRGGPRQVVICHNVLPHERIRMDERLVTALLDAADQALVHSDAQADQARALTRTPVCTAQLAPFMPESFVRRAPAPGVHRRLMFFGLVRPYKGLDVLLRALAQGPEGVQLRVAGEFWGGLPAAMELCRDLGIADRVELRDGYVAASQVPSLFADVDALVLPYRSATGSQAVWTGFEFGVPVIASRVGRLAADIRDGIDGLVVEPDDIASLADALHRFYENDTAEKLRAQVRPIDPEPYWAKYLDVLLGAPPQISTRRPQSGKDTMAQAAPPGGTLLHLAKIGAERALWARVAAKRALATRRGSSLPLPMRVPPSEVLTTVADWQAAVVECRRLGLPLHRDLPKNWDALGAVSTVLHELGTDIRVLDAGAARYSSVLPWLRLYGVRELIGNNLEFVKSIQHGPVRFEPGDITATQYRDGWFDAVTCMSVIEHGVPLEPFAVEMARVVRPGGLLVVSTDYDQAPPDTTGKFAYGVPVKIFGPEDIQQFVKIAESHGLALLGDLRLAHKSRPVHWKRTGLDYTFIRLSFRRVA